MNLDTMRLLVAKGLSAADILEVAEAMAVRVDPTAAERQARHRAKGKAERDSVTRDVTRDSNAAPALSPSPNEKKSNPHPHTHPDLTTRARETAVSRPDDVSAQTWDDWLRHRRRIKADVTSTAVAGVRREAEKIGWSMEAALTESVTQGWRGFKADWVENRKATGPPAGRGASLATLAAEVRQLHAT